jgi:MinD superfamily P-loop ATPase
MKQLTIISGKGGTGKTTLTAAFAHLILRPTIIREEPCYGGQLPVIDKGRCTQCGLCEEKCRFRAIQKLEMDFISCEGCGVCAYVCPEKAIIMQERLSGQWFISETREGPMVHARLDIAQANSGKLVSMVRQQAKELAERENMDLILIDGPPGIGCPVIASISGADLVLAVTEPTLSGIHDLKRVVEVAEHFNIPSLVCINKFNINLVNTLRIEDYCEENGIALVGRIPFDPSVTQAMISSLSVVEYPCGKVTEEVKEIWEKVEDRL